MWDCDDALDAGAGQRRRKAGVIYDYQSNPAYALTVRVDDGNGGVDSMAVTIDLWAVPRLRAGTADGDRPSEGPVERLRGTGPSVRAGSVGEERELMILLAVNRAKMASQREIAIAYWGLEEVAKHWDTADWMRARVRYRLDVARGIERGRRASGDSGGSPAA